MNHVKPSSRNAIGNAHNAYQGPFRRVLCVCSAGMLRSPTLARILSMPPYDFNTRAVGYSNDFALVGLEEHHLHWAEEIFVMNLETKLYIIDSMKHYGIKERPIYNLELDDIYSFRQPELVEIMTDKLKEIYPEFNNEEEETEV